MLGKLFKHDFKNLGAFYLPVYLIYVGVTAAFTLFLVIGINSSSTFMENDIFSLLFGIITFVYVLAMIALILFSGLIVVYYFYRKFVTEEAYLTMTLPVSPFQHILSKLLASALWRLFTWILFGVSIYLILLATGAMKEIGNNITVQFAFRSIWYQLKYELGMNAGAMVLTVIYGIITLLTSPLIYFASMSIGQMAGKHKVLMSVAAFVVINIVVTFLTANISLLELQSEAFGFMILAIIECIITTAIYYGITVYFLGRELNLE